MEVIRDWRGFSAGRRGGVLCVGNFDGVHVGHRAMLMAGREEARRRGVSFVVMTFEPHPATVLRPGGVRRPLVTWGQKEELLAELGVDVVVVVEPTREFLGMEAERFLGDVVRDVIGAKVMVEGPTFTFGKGAKGDVGMLMREGGRFGVEVRVVGTEEVTLSDLTRVKVSSSLVRWLVERGRVVDAGKCLGRAYAVRGEVVKGEQRGRTIGYPTANVKAGVLVPGSGVYGGWVRLADGRRFRGAISVGTNPQFQGKETTVEVYLVGFAGELYGEVVEVAFERWVREMGVFGGVEALVRRIGEDVEEVGNLS